MKRKVWAGFVMVLIGSLILSACGGGGGGGGESSTTPAPTSATISGVAAAGAPIIGFAYLKDSAGHTLGPNNIAQDGSFSFDVTGLTAPFYLRAEGTAGSTGYDLYSATTGAGTANINPLTNVAVAAAAGVTNPAGVYGNPAQYPITQANLDKAIADIQNMLKPLLDAYNANVNPITGSYTANHTGLDGVLDVVKVELNTTSGAVTVTDKTTNTAMGSTTTTTIGSAAQVTNIPSAQTVTDLQEIATMLSNYATALNKGASLTPADLDPFYATNYGINDGLDRTQTIIDEITDIPTSRGKTFSTITNLVIEEKYGNGDYRISGVAYFQDGSFGFWEEGLIMTKENGTWKLKGNGFKSEVNINFETIAWRKMDNTVQIESGIDVGGEVEDRGNFGLQSAVITGPGLPQGGITLSKPQNEPVNLYLDQAFRNCTGPTDNWNLYVLSDTDIDSIPDNAVYTITIRDAGNAVVETRTRTLLKRPYKRSELTAGHFATGHATSHKLSDYVGKTLSVTYAKPTAYVTAWMELSFSYWNYSGNSARFDYELFLNQTSTSVTISTPAWTPQQGFICLQVDDAYKRTIKNRWMLEP
jgi:hypothetical protein